MSTATRVIKNTGWLYAKMGITIFISLWTTRLILNGLGVSDFGIFNVVGGAIAMLGFLNSSMASATQRFMSYAEGEGNKEKQKVIFNISIVLHFFIAIIVGLCLIISGYFFFNGILSIPEGRTFAAIIVYSSLIISTLFTIMNVPYDAIMNAHENMKYFAVVGIFESVLKLFVAFVCLSSPIDKLIVYGILMACIPIITLSIMKVYCHKHYKECYFSPVKLWNKSMAIEIISFAGWNFFFTGASMISAYGQGIVLNSFFGTILNAAQGVSGQLNGQLQSLSANLMKAINPIFAKSAGASNKELLFRATWYGAKFSTAVYLIVAIPFFIYTERILCFWLGNVPEWTCIFVRLQLVRTFLEFQFGPVCSMVNANGKIKWFCIVSAILNGIQLPTIYWLFTIGYPPYVMYLVAMFFGNILVYTVAFIVDYRTCGFSFQIFIDKVSIPLLLSLLPIVFCYFFVLSRLSYDGYYIIINMAFFSIMYLVSFYIVGCQKEEKALLQNLLNKLIHRL